MKQPKYNPGDIVHVIPRGFYQDIRSAQIVFSTSFSLDNRPRIAYKLSDGEHYEEVEIFPSFGEALQSIKKIT